MFFSDNVWYYFFLKQGYTYSGQVEGITSGSLLAVVARNGRYYKLERFNNKQNKN